MLRFIKSIWHGYRHLHQLRTAMQMLDSAQRAKEAHYVALRKQDKTNGE